jgi:hypothetical protein
VFSINLNVGYYDGIELTDTTLIYYSNLDPNNEKEIYNITWEIIDKLSYINFNYNGKFLGNKVTHGQKKYLVLYSNDYIAFYDNNNMLVWIALSRYYEFSSGLGSVAEATSELREGNIIYSVNNLLDLKFLMPWAEGKVGAGIGEKIRFSPRPNSNTRTVEAQRYFRIDISNGFVDFNRPYLYEYNNRIKKIRISRGNPAEYVDIELEDTPQFQIFNFYKELNTETNILEIEILEVYSGSHYNDTCVNFIVTWAYDNRGF